MSEYKLKTGKLGEKVVGAYKKVEDAFVDAFLEQGGEGEGDLRLKTGKVGKAVVKGYQDVEDAFVGAYKKIEDAFVDRFLEKVEPEQGTSGEVACPEEGAKDRENRAASDPRSSL